MGEDIAQEFTPRRRSGGCRVLRLITTTDSTPYSIHIRTTCIVRVPHAPIIHIALYS